MPAPAPGLTPQQLAFWEENGYLILPDFLGQALTSELLEETRSMLRDFSLEDHPMTKFSTGQNGNAHVGDEYFLGSNDKVRFFFEEDAFSPEGKLLKPKERSINKIGHCLHGLVPSFRKATVTRRNAAIARDLGFKDPRVLQSMVICKQPEIGGEVPPHQDSTFLYTDPPSAVGLWFALEDTTVTNGCISFIKGSHRQAPVASRFVRKTDGGTDFADNDGAKFPRALKTDENAEIDHEAYEMCEMKAGSLAIIHGNVLHRSERNLSPKGRIIYTFHMIEGSEKYDERNWLHPTGDGFTRLLDEAAALPE